MDKNEIIKYWDDNICQGHINSEAAIVIEYFKNKGVTDIKFIDIGANVGKYYDVLSNHFNIKNCVMYEGSRSLTDYLKTKFKDVPTAEVFNYAISNEDKLVYFSEDSIEYSVNNGTLEGLNLGLSQVSPNSGIPTQMRDIYGLLNERFEFFSDFNFIKIDTETLDYYILDSLKNFIKRLKVKPFICFEHNYHNTMSSEVAKQIYDKFLLECGYVGNNFESLSGDISLLPIESTTNTRINNCDSSTINNEVSYLISAKFK